MDLGSVSGHTVNIDRGSGTKGRKGVSAVIWSVWIWDTPTVTSDVPEAGRRFQKGKVIESFWSQLDGLELLFQMSGVFLST